MKKLILFSVLFLFGMISVQAQKMTFASGTDTVVDADIHYYPITQYLPARDILRFKCTLIISQDHRTLPRSPFRDQRIIPTGIH